MSYSSFGDPETLYVLKGEALIYHGTITPKSCAMSVQITSEELTSKILERWLLQSLTPLVGTKAAAELKILLEDKRDLFSPFLREALEFRRSVK